LSKFSVGILRISTFRYLLLTRMFAVTATQAQAVIVGWQVYSLTGSTFMLGLTGLVEAVPAILCALYAGHVVDISHPKRIFSLCLGVLSLNTAVLVVFAGGFVPLTNDITLVVIFLVIFVSGLARSFIMPSAFALLPLIIRREDMASASSWQTTAFQIAAIGGPAAAGLIYAVFGARGAWIFAFFMMAAAVVCALLMRIDFDYKKPEQRPTAAKNIKEGWVFLLQNRTLLSIMSLDMLAVLFGGAVAVLPAFAHQVLHTGAEGLGLLRAAPAAGAVITALYFAVNPMKKITAVRMFFVVAGFGVCMIGFGLSTTLWTALFFLALSGAFDSISMVIRGTLMQLLTPEHMRGRVSSVNSMFIISSNEIGAFYSGAMATLMGLVPSIVVGGIGTMAVVSVTAYFSKNFRKMSVDSTQ
jgi:MFS family permease